MKVDYNFFLVYVNGLHLLLLTKLLSIFTLNISLALGQVENLKPLILSQDTSMILLPLYLTVKETVQK